MKNQRKTLMRHKGFFAFSVGTLLLSACAPIFQQPIANVNQNLTTKIDHQTLADFNGAKWTLNDAVHDYLKTFSGLKTLSTNFVNLMIYYFYESLQHIGDNLSRNSIFVANQMLGEWTSQFSAINNQISNLENSAKEQTNQDEAAFLQRTWDRFGGSKERYKVLNSLVNLRNKFFDNLLATNYLNLEGNDYSDQARLTNNSDEWSKIKFENDKLNDPLAKVLADFQQFLFEDWYSFTNPIAVVKVNWKYASQDVTENGVPILETIYDKNTLSLLGTTLPEAANYEFPAFSQATNTKFKTFIEQLDQISNANTNVFNAVKNYSDQETTWQLVSLTDLATTEDASSQMLASILHLYQLNSKLKDTDNSIVGVNLLNKNDVDKNYLLNNFLLKKQTNNQSNQIDQKLAYGIKIDGANLFKANTEYYKNNLFSEFVYDIRDLQTDVNNNHWVLFKDKNGANALSIDGIAKLKTNTPDNDFNKQMLLWRGFLFKNNITLDDGVQFDLMQTLKDYLSQNFEAILLRYMITKFSTPDTSRVNGVLEASTRKDLRTPSASETNTNIFNGELVGRGNKFFNGTYNPFYKNSEFQNNNGNDKLVNLLKTASEVLKTHYFTNKLFSLRQKLFGDYEKFLGTDPRKVANTSNGHDFYSSFNNGLASKLPFTFSVDYSRANNTQHYGQFDVLEKYFHAQTDGSVHYAYYAHDKLKQVFEQYLASLKQYFATGFGTQFLYDSDAHRKAAQTFHFANQSKIQKNVLSIEPIDAILLEAIRKSGMDQKAFAKLVQQKALQAVVKRYYDYEQKQWVLTDNPVSEIFGADFKRQFMQNFHLSFSSREFIEQKVKLLYGGFDASANTAANYAKLLETIFYNNHYVNGIYGYDLLSDQLLADFKRFVTIDWLLSNQLDHLRNYLYHHLGPNNFAVFLWTNDGVQSSNHGTSSLSQNNNGDFQFSLDAQNLVKSPFINAKDFVEITNQNNVQNNWSFADIKLDANTSISAVGFKGLVKSDDQLEGLNSNVKDLVFNRFQSSLSSQDNRGVLYRWGSFDNLVHEVKSIRTFSQLTSIVDVLSAAFTNISFENVNRTTIQSPVANSVPITLSLKQRVNALLNILYGYEYFYRTDSLAIFEQTVDQIYHNPPTTPNQCHDTNNSRHCPFNDDKTGIINSDAFKQFMGSLRNGINNSPQPYAISLGENNLSSVAYIQQINSHDVANQENFLKYIKNISVDVLLQTLFKAAADVRVQEQAMFDLVNYNPNFLKPVVYDQILFDHLDLNIATVYAKKLN